MRVRQLVLSGWLLLPCLGAAPADAASIRVGELAVGVSEIQRRLERAPRRDWLTTDGDRRTRLRALVERVVVPELRWEAHAARVLTNDAEFRHMRDAALATALEDQLTRTVELTPNDVAAFYAANLRHYVQPEAIHLWRILVASPEQGREILAKVKDQRLGVYEWGNLARERSLDEATKHRDGSLGFVQADGQTDVPELRVDPNLVAAARRVRDGELVPDPVPESSSFAVIWRRGTRPEKRETLESQREHIRVILLRDRARAARDQLLRELAAKHVQSLAPELVERLPDGPPEP